MRKLIESHEVSVQFRQRQIPVRRSNVISNPPHTISADDIADCYDLENGTRATLYVVDLCQMILRNTVFTFCCGETNDLFDGIYVSSDRDKDRYVYLILASDFIALCCDIGADG